MSTVAKKSNDQVSESGYGWAQTANHHGGICLVHDYRDARLRN
jgi:hypothetical protein